MRRRVQCRQCGVVAEKLPWSDGQHHSTKAHKLFLAHWARKLSWKEVAESFPDTWDRVHDAVEYVVEWGLQHRTLESIYAIGVDEIQYAKGHKYLTLVYQIDRECIRLLWIGKERTIESFQGFFKVIGEKVASEILFVCSDMWQPYLDVIRQKCAHALHILDRFHIAAKMSKAPGPGSCRRNTALVPRRLPAGVEEVALVCAQAPGESHSPATSAASRPAPLQPSNGSRVSIEGRLSAVLELQLPVLGWQVPGLLVSPDHAQPNRADEEDRPHPENSSRVAAQLFQGQEAVLQRCVEGLNNKAKVVMRRSYGFRTFRVLELALYHSLAKLPEPTLTSRILLTSPIDLSAQPSSSSRFKTSRTFILRLKPTQARVSRQAWVSAIFVQFTKSPIR